MAAIFVVSGIPNMGPLPANASDKLAHFAAYGLLGVLLTRAFAGARWEGYTTSAALRAWTVAALYGVTDEFHQSFVPGRSQSVGDGVADAAGAAIGGLVVLSAVRWARRDVRKTAKYNFRE
jgi:VanZ family protein